MAQQQAANPAAPFIDRRARNLAFFQKRYPQLYEYFKDYKLQRFKLNILTETGEVDLWEDGRSIYDGRAREEGAREVDLFRDKFHEGTLVHTVNPTFAGSYRHPRFAHRAVDRLLQQSPLRPEQFNGYRLPDYYPMIVFLGIGLGYQIEKMVREEKVENLLIVEPNTDRFAASLYAVDWERICRDYSVDGGRTLHFLIGIEAEENMLWGAVWNELIQRCPVFPMLTLFHVHRGDPLFTRVAEKVNENMHLFLSSWGHYDDEVRQLNNALHAFHEPVKIIPPRAENATDKPVAIIGSGPSLDARIETLRRNRDRLILVSAGTALGALISYDLLPDFHVEVESDAVNYKVISELDHAVLAQIPIIGPSQLCPAIWELFRDQRLYFKKESAIASLFGREEETIADGTPTCTNAALVVCLHLGFRNFYLFGLDYGYRDPTRHHSKGTRYGKEGSYLEQAGNAFPTNQVLDEGVDGERIYSTPTFFSSKRKLELAMRDAINSLADASFHNCSDGARLDSAEWIPLEKMEEALEQNPVIPPEERQQLMASVYAPDARQVDLDTVQSRLYSMRKMLEAVSRDVDELFARMRLNGQKDALRLALRLNTYVQKTLRDAQPGFYFLIRGTLWHFLYAGIAQVFSIEDEVEQLKYLRKWAEATRRTFRTLPAHFAAVTGKAFDRNSDPWVLQTIDDEEASPRQWFEQAGVEPPEGVKVLD